MNTPFDLPGQSSTPTLVLDDELFWTAWRAMPYRFCGLDYDGTLAPFQVDRMAAAPLPGIIEVLKTLCEQTSTRLAIISGRKAEEVATLLGGLEVTIVGSHGYEVLSPGQTLRQVPLQPQQIKGLALAQHAVTALKLTDRVESKVASLALHTRGLPPNQARQIEATVGRVWSAGAEAAGLHCRAFNGGIELRAMGVDKGTALEKLLTAQPPGGFAVYLGDDQTDEDAFRVIQTRGGTGIKVGEAAQPTLAQGWLPDCAAVLNFLRRWSVECRK